MTTKQHRVPENLRIRAKESSILGKALLLIRDLNGMSARFGLRSAHKHVTVQIEESSHQAAIVYSPVPAIRENDRNICAYCKGSLERFLKRTLKLVSIGVSEVKGTQGFPGG
jgi:hypothetical protein